MTGQKLLTVCQSLDAEDDQLCVIKHISLSQTCESVNKFLSYTIIIYKPCPYEKCLEVLKKVIIFSSWMRSQGIIFAVIVPQQRQFSLSSVLHNIRFNQMLGRKVMTNLDSILKSRDITLPTKVHLVKAMVFPVVMYGCECWTVKKAEHRRIDAFEQWCWRRLLRIP